MNRFLLARLHIESLASAAALSIKHVRKKLRTLPNTLVDTYDDAMRRIEAQEPDHSEIALRTLAWVSYAFRPLSLRELQHALMVEPGNSTLDEELLLDEQSITALCAGLVVVEPNNKAVNLVHYTTKKYFENIRLVRFPGFHANITMSCATYLALEELKDTKIWEIVQHYPLACYAAEYMGDHARQSPEETLEPSILRVICHLLSHPNKRKPLLSLLDGLDLIRSGFYSSGKRETFVDDPKPISRVGTGVHEKSSPKDRWPLSSESIASEMSDITLTNSPMGPLKSDENVSKPDKVNIYRNHIPEVTALHLAVSMGLAKVASMLLNEVPNIDAVDITGKTALTVAIERGFEKAVEFLVNSGASVDLTTEHGQGVFLLTTESNWRKAADTIASNARLTLSNDHTSHEQFLKRLLLAAYDGDGVEVEHLKLEKAINMTAKESKIAATALFLGVERNHHHVVQGLLDAGVDISSKDNTGQTSLHRAIRRGNEGIIRLLIMNGADVDCKNDDGLTPWSANLRSRNVFLLNILLEAGANPSTRGHQGVNELYNAATNGETEVVRYMLENGTNPSIKTQFGWAPLHWASYYGHLDCVNLLLDAGAELSPISDQDATPLDLALRAGQVAIIDILTRAGALESRDVVTVPSILAEDETPADGWSSSLPKEGEEITQQSKLSLVFDKPIQQGLNVGQFIYPSTIKAPTNYIYQISHTLETLVSTLGIRQANRRADMIEYPLRSESFDSNEALYNIGRITLDYQKFEIRPKQQSPISGIVKMHRDWTGGWKIYHHHLDGLKDYLFRTTPDWSRLKEDGCRWMTENGTLLARSGLDGVTPVFTFEPGSDRTMHDILVSCWTAKLWSETVASLEIARMKPLNE